MSSAICFNLDQSKILLSQVMGLLKYWIQIKADMNLQLFGSYFCDENFCFFAVNYGLIITRKMLGRIRKCELKLQAHAQKNVAQSVLCGT